MTDTQLASMRLGSVLSDTDIRKKKPHAEMIHITDGQTDGILDVITAQNIIDNVHRKSLEDTLETFDFTTFGDKRFSQYLEKRNRVIIPDEGGSLVEFVIHESDKYRDSEGLKVNVYSSASYLDLKKARIIDPQSLESYTASAATGFALNDTEWRPGIIEGEGARTFHIENPTNPYSFLKTIANEFDLELNFRVEHDGRKITGRFVDLLERVGNWQGREIEFGRDLVGIRRVEKTDNIVTALRGYGPEREDGTRLEVFVEDEEALQRWGRPHPLTGELMHLVETYEPQSTRQDMTLEELEQYTRTELNKRINEIVTYETDVADLEHVPGMENKQIRFGDTIKIKDTKFNPPIYLEARVFEVERSITDKSQKKIKLGDYTEYTEEEVMAIWQQLAERIREKISAQQLYEYTYDKLTIDNKDDNVRTDAESYANTVSSQAKDEAITYTNNTVEPIIVSVGELEKDVSEIENDLGEIDTRLVVAETNITQAFDEIELRATKTELNTVEQRVENAEGEISVLAGEVELRATKTEVDAIEGRLSTAESSINVLFDEIDLRVEKDGVIAAINLSSEGLLIDVDRVNITGDVEIEGGELKVRHLSAATGTFTGTLQGTEIIGSTYFAGEGDNTITINGEHLINKFWDAYNLRNHRAMLTSGQIDVEDDTSGYWENTRRSRIASTYMEVSNAAIDGVRRYVRLGMDSSARGYLEYVSPSSPSLNYGLTFRDDINQIDVSHELGFPNASGTSPVAINMTMDNMISVYQDGIVMYGNREGESSVPFRVRSHSNRSNYRNDFYVTSLGIQSPLTPDNTYSASANVYITDLGTFGRVSSSVKYKKDIEDLDIELAKKVLELRPVWYRAKEGSEPQREGWSYVGLIAEEVAEIEPRLAHFRTRRLEFDEEGNEIITELDKPEPEGVQYDRIGVYLLPIVRDQQERIEELENQLERLKGDNQIEH